MANNRDLRAQVMCLSALFLAIDGVRQLAHTGKVSGQVVNTLLPALVRYDCETISGYFGAVEPLNHGRELLLKLLEQDIETDYVRYSIQLMHVEKKLSKNRALMDELIHGLSGVRRQHEHYPLTHENIIANLASLYQRTASEAAPKIMIHGSPQYLQQKQTVEMIRALLLCAIRVVALWRANGGSRWQLMFSRQAIALASDEPFTSSKY